MEVHRPKKPIEGLRDLAKEVGVIVLGVAIALAGEQLVEFLHDRHVAAEAREAVRSEVVYNMRVIGLRQAQETCIDRRLEEIASRLDGAGSGALAEPVGWIGQPADSLTAVGAWQAATGAGRAALFRVEEQSLYARVYSYFAAYNAENDREQAAWAQLRALETWRGPLTEAGRIHFSQALQQARYERWKMASLAGVAAHEAGQLGLSIGSRAEVLRMSDLKELPRAVCLPITTSRRQALAVLKDPAGQPQ